MTAPAVSIVVPCYNGGQFLDQMLASLDAQVFRDFEVIIVDDGSTDPETIAKLASPPAGVTVVHQANAGLSAARNAGFRAARGDLVLPLDCDDALSPTFLAETVAALKAAPAELAFAFTDMRATGAIQGILPRYFIRFDQLFLNRLPYCLLLRKRAWEAVGGYDETMLDGYEDWEFNIRLTVAGFGGVGIPQPLFIYCVSPDGMLMSRSARLHGKLWRDILRRHSEIYNWKMLREMKRRWREPGSRFNLGMAMLLVWGGHFLPARLVSMLFYHLLQTVHWLRWRRGVLPVPE